MHFWPFVDFGQRLTFWSTLTKVNPHLLLTIQTWPGPLFHSVIQSSCLLMIFLITSFASKWLCAHHAIWTPLNQRSLALVYPKLGPNLTLSCLDLPPKSMCAPLLIILQQHHKHITSGEPTKSKPSHVSKLQQGHECLQLSQAIGHTC